MLSDIVQYLNWYNGAMWYEWYNRTFNILVELFSTYINALTSYTV